MKHILKPALSLFLIAAITTALLGFVYRLTLEPIENQHRQTKEITMREIMAGASSFRELEVSKTGSIVRVFEGLNGGNTEGYIIELSANGYSGTIEMMVGISKAENEITGMRILRHSETPGLGAQAVRAAFYNRYNNRELNPLRVVKASPGANEIEALTGATITTRAITEAVNEAIEWYNGGGIR